MAGKTFAERNWDMKVRSITKVERQKEDSDSIVYRLLARDKDGVNEVTIESAAPFTGISAHDGVIQVKLLNSQLSITDFGEKKKPGRKKKEEE